MQILLKEHRHLVQLLCEAEVDFILIGGYAVIYHGYPRTTDDLDIWIKPDNEIKANLLSVLGEIGIDEEDLQQLRKADFTGPLAFHFGEPPQRVDFLTHLSGLKFDEAKKAQVYFSIGNCKVPVLHLHDLITNKLQSTRMKDKADVEELQKIIRLRK